MALFNERKEMVGMDLYDAEIRYTDDGHEASSIETFQELGIWDNTVIVMTSDHGEEFFEHDVFGPWLLALPAGRHRRAR